jgi:hypothetical protein
MVEAREAADANGDDLSDLIRRTAGRSGHKDPGTPGPEPLAFPRALTSGGPPSVPPGWQDSTAKHQLLEADSGQAADTVYFAPLIPQLVENQSGPFRLFRHPIGPRLGVAHRVANRRI